MAANRPAAIDDLDFRGSPRLTGVAEWVWYLVAGVTYIVAGMWHKWLLNWIIGPVWLVTVICIGPPIVDRLRRATPVRGRR